MPSRREYHVTKHKRRPRRGSLVDRGCNGGIVGADVRVIYKYPGQEVDVTGIDNHQLNSLALVDAVGKTISNHGPVLAICRQYAHHAAASRSIHSCIQIEHYKNRVNDVSKLAPGGGQYIKTLHGYFLPIDIENGLPYLKMEPPSDDDMNTLPVVILTSDGRWDPRVLDNVISDNDEWHQDIKPMDDGLVQSDWDAFGEYKKLTPPQPFIKLADPADPLPSIEEALLPQPDINDRSDDIDDDDLEVNHYSLRKAFHVLRNLNTVLITPERELTQAFPTESSPADPDPTPGQTSSIESPSSTSTPKRRDYKKFAPYFLFVPLEKIRKTFENATQCATNVVCGPHITQTIRSPYPALNIHRRHEDVMTDTVYAEVPAIDTGGQTMAQIFIGRSSHVCDVFGMTNEKEFVNTLSDVIRKRGAMDTLVSDHAAVEMSRRVEEVLRQCHTKSRQMEPNYQHQNFAEHRYRHIKRHHKFIMNYRDVDPCAWLLCLKWITDVMNMTAEESLHWRTPLEVLTGQTTDISIALLFMFWDVVYVSRYKDKHYSGGIGTKKSDEIRGRFVGFSWNVGHALTFLILTDDSRKVISRSRVRLANVPENNLKLDREAGEEPDGLPIIKSKYNPEDKEDVQLPTINITESPILAEYDRREQEERLSPKEAGEPTSIPNAATGQETGEQTSNEEKAPKTTEGGEQPKLTPPKTTKIGELPKSNPNKP